MKLTRITSAALALALAAALGTSARAVTYANASTGDLILGFEQSGVNTNYEVDLGSVSQILNATPGSTLTFHLSTADLNNVFGSGVWTDNDVNDAPLVQWGVIAGGNGNTSTVVGGNTLQANTIFYTQGRLTSGTQTADPSLSANTQAFINSNFTNFEATAFNGGIKVTSGSTPSLQAITVGTSTGWSSYSPSTTAFSVGSSIEQPLSGSFTGPTDSFLDLYEFNATSSTSQPGTFLGDFSLGNDGTLTFNVAAATPEPSTYALLGLGLAALVWRLRRKAVLSL